MIKIGDKEFKFKKDALAYYKNILNAHKFGSSLNKNDFNDLLALIDYDNSFYSLDNTIEEQKFIIKEIAEIKEINIAKVQFNTKCFQIICNSCVKGIIIAS